MSLIVLPSTLGVALPCNNYDITINHPYFKKALEHADTVENFVIAFVNSMDLFDDPSKIDEVSVPLISCFACVCEFREYKNVVKNDDVESKVAVFAGIYPCTLHGLRYDSEDGLIHVDVEERLDQAVSAIELEKYDNKIRKKYEEIRKNYPVLEPLSSYSDEFMLESRPYIYAHEFDLNDDFCLRLLRENNPQFRYHLVIDALSALDKTPTIRAEIDTKVSNALAKSQREYILREQAKVVRELLKEFDGEDNDAKYQKALGEGLNRFPQCAIDRIKSESSRLKLLGNANQEAAMCRNYLDLLLKLPWKVSSEDNDDLINVKNVLDEDHYGLKTQKERILEYLAVKSMTKSLKAPILCLYGPPGTGKTSLAISIARALNRKFVKFALGGVYDESEIRGHRRTYVGALPGRIIAGIANAGTNNPVFLLDEIDKMTGGGYHGDPAAALLEILDPEQNVFFEDHYLDMPFDLSKVLFICTANDLGGIPSPLRDRLELIELNTYTLFEKIHIAKNHLIKQELEANGLTDSMIKFDEDSLSYIIDSYTREAGVRELRRKIGTIMRKFSVDMLSKKVEPPFKVTKEVVEEYLKKPIYFHTASVSGQVGIVNGLAYTAYGGELLPIECNVTKGSGRLIHTGNLGDVMKESVQIAFSYVKVLSQKYGFGPKYYDTHDFHVHCPEGAIPKDGPSAGCALAIVILSAVTNIPLNNLVAMTGEVDLRDRKSVV